MDALGNAFSGRFQVVGEGVKRRGKENCGRIFAEKEDSAALTELAELFYVATRECERRLRALAEQVVETVARTRLGLAKALELELLELDGSWKVKIFGTNAPRIAKKWWKRSAPLAMELAASFDELAKTLRADTAALTAPLRKAVAEIERAEADGNGELAKAILRDLAAKTSFFRDASETNDFSEIGDGKEWRE